MGQRRERRSLWMARSSESSAVGSAFAFAFAFTPVVVVVVGCSASANQVDGCGRGGISSPGCFDSCTMR